MLFDLARIFAVPTPIGLLLCFLTLSGNATGPEKAVTMTVTWRFEVEGSQVRRYGSTKAYGVEDNFRRSLSAV